MYFLLVSSSSRLSLSCFSCSSTKSRARDTSRSAGAGHEHEHAENDQPDEHRRYEGEEDVVLHLIVEQEDPLVPPELARVVAQRVALALPHPEPPVQATGDDGAEHDVAEPDL